VGRDTIFVLTIFGQYLFLHLDMTFAFHHSQDTYFQYQLETTRQYILPFLRKYMTFQPGMRVLEVGCAQGGVLKAFLDEGCIGTGVELHEGNYNQAKRFLAKELENDTCRIFHKNIYDPKIAEEFASHFDLIVLKDVVEHIPDTLKLLKTLHSFLRPNGRIFFGFPPWQMPFGGHQQGCKGIAGVLPWVHILPNMLYLNLYRLLGQSEQMIAELADVKSTRITIERFERSAKSSGLTIIGKTLWLINPIYSLKFNLQPREQLPLLRDMPYVRNFYTTCGYYLIGPSKPA
jgi:cyclopropane fatty-acyl-phospholipid synthase-like methyltransferase